MARKLRQRENVCIILSMKVSQLGEFGLIELLAEIVTKSKLPQAQKRELILGIGDDAAAWRTGAGVRLGTTDTLVQDVHFTLSTATWNELGWKALAVNLSDIAAMGGRPSYALVSLGLPADTEVASVTELYEGMAQLAHEFDVAIVGGDVVEAPLVVINLTVLGSAEDDSILTRSGALPGDQIAVTGYLGSSAAGLQMLLGKELVFDEETTDFLRQAHLRPNPRVAEGQTLVRHGVRVAIDLSDGLVGDLTHVCKASGVGARVMLGKLPIHPLVRAAFGEGSLELAATGGEDYELLFTAKKDVVEQVKKLMPVPATVIGEIVKDEPGRVTLLDDKGSIVNWDKKGWRHFTGELDEARHS